MMCPLEKERWVCDTSGVKVRFRGSPCEPAMFRSGMIGKREPQQVLEVERMHLPLGRDTCFPEFCEVLFCVYPLGSQ